MGDLGGVGMIGRLRAVGSDVGLLLLRLAAAGFMIYGHGWPKLSRWETLSQSFADPFGLGPTASLALAIFAEIGCSIAIALGLLTRLSAVPLLITMLVAAFIAHAGDPFRQKELALLYAFVFQFLILAGPGRLSLDHLIWSRLRRGSKQPGSAAGLSAAS